MFKNSKRNVKYTNSYDYYPIPHLYEMSDDGRFIVNNNRYDNGGETNPFSSNQNTTNIPPIFQDIETYRDRIGYVSYDEYQRLRNNYLNNAENVAKNMRYASYTNHRRLYDEKYLPTLSEVVINVPKHKYINRLYQDTMEEKKAFVENSFDDWYYTLTNKGFSNQAAANTAGLLALQDAKESYYGTDSTAYNNHNYGGMNDYAKARSKNRLYYPRYYNTMSDYYEAKYNMLNANWPSFKNATSISEYYNAVNPPTGKQYAPPQTNPDYLPGMLNMKSAQKWISDYQKNYQSK